MCFSSYKNFKFKVNCDELELTKEKQCIFCNIYFLQRKIYSVWSKLSGYILLLTEKHYLIHFCCLFLQSPKIFSVSLTDLSKAYDCLSQALIIFKLNGYGFSLAELRLIHDYLSNKQQRTKVTFNYFKVQCLDLYY